MIFGERSFKLKVAHATDENLERRLVEAFAHRQFDVAECGEKLRKLTRLSVPEERFLAGILQILDVKPPARKGRLLDLLARLQPLVDEFPEVDATLVPLDDAEVCLSRGPARATAAGPAGRTVPSG